MATETETFKFSELPLVVSGNEVVATVNGEVDWKLHQNGTIKHVVELRLYGESGALIEIDRDEDIYPAVSMALEGLALVRANAKKPAPELDKSESEGAPSET